jgi:hypothetical protein
MGKKLIIYMIDGTEYGPRLSEIGNWVGKALYSPRYAVNKIIERSEFNNPGIYCLKGDSTDEAFDEKVYIGVAENIRSRLKQHLSDPGKDFKELIFFISKDELLTQTQIQYLESRIIQLALGAKTAQIENRISPSLPTLHEADVSDMEFFLKQIKLILPVMGFRFLIPSTVKQMSSAGDLNRAQEVEIFKIRSKKYKAHMYESDQGYIVTKGSEAKKDLSNSITKTYRNLRRKLLETKILIDKEDRYEFNEDAIFSSPSAASNIVLGRSSSGFSEWVTDKGKTFKEIQELNNE